MEWIFEISPDMHRLCMSLDRTEAGPTMSSDKRGLRNRDGSLLKGCSRPFKKGTTYLGPPSGYARARQQRQRHVQQTHMMTQGMLTLTALARQRVEEAQQREAESAQELEEAQEAKREAEAARKEATSESTGLQGEAEQLRERIAQDDQHVQVNQCVLLLRNWQLPSRPRSRAAKLSSGADPPCSG